MISAEAAKMAVGGLILRPSSAPMDKATRTDEAKASSSKKAGGAVGAARDGRDTGAALRSIYRETVDEAIPPEMLDLLSKLD